MIKTNHSNIGVDDVINDIQESLYHNIVDTWDGEVDGYGRLYKNTRDGSYKAEYYISENDYLPVSYNDNKAGQFFFLVDDNSETEDGILYTVKCKCVFAINLVQILGIGRNDQEAQRDVVQFLRDINGDYEITGIETGIENVFRGYDISDIKHSDINPKHLFSVNLNLNYYLTDKCT